MRRNACSALANMGPEGETALIELLHSDDRYARDRAAATMEARGFTRRAVRNLAKPGRRGARARDTVSTLIKVGSTRYLTGLARTLTDGDGRDALREMLAEHGILDAASLDEDTTDEAPSPEAATPSEMPSNGGSEEEYPADEVASADAGRREG